MQGCRLQASACVCVCVCVGRWVHAFVCGCTCLCVCVCKCVCVQLYLTECWVEGLLSESTEAAVLLPVADLAHLPAASSVKADINKNRF